MKSYWIVSSRYVHLVVSGFALSVSIRPLFELVGEANGNIDGNFGQEYDFTDI